MANPNPGAEMFKILLSRPNSSVSWGFRLQGGADFSTPLSIQLVSEIQIKSHIFCITLPFYTGPISARTGAYWCVLV